MSTKDLGYGAERIQKINVNAFSACVAVKRGIADEALRGQNAGKVKGRSVKARRL